MYVAELVNLYVRKFNLETILDANYKVLTLYGIAMLQIFVSLVDYKTINFHCRLRKCEDL
jgi:hypothetical protein